MSETLAELIPLDAERFDEIAKAQPALIGIPVYQRGDDASIVWPKPSARTGFERVGLSQPPGTGPIADVFVDDAGRFTVVRDGVSYVFDTASQEWNRVE